MGPIDKRFHREFKQNHRSSLVLNGNVLNTVKILYFLSETVFETRDVLRICRASQWKLKRWKKRRRANLDWRSHHGGINRSRCRGKDDPGGTLGDNLSSLNPAGAERAGSDLGDLQMTLSPHKPNYLVLTGRNERRRLSVRHPDAICMETTTETTKTTSTDR